MRWPIVVCLFTSISFAADISVLPKPATLEPKDGQFTLRPTTDILPQAGSAGIESAAKYFSRHVRLATGFEPQVSPTLRTDVPRNCIVLSTNGADPNLGDEGYDLLVIPDSVVIRAPKPAGIFYGLQTLRQLLPPEIESVQRVDNIPWTIPCLHIIDKPRFRWRGLSLDCTHTFLRREDILRTIDLMALHKLNILILQLTGDAAWRFPVPGYEKLSQDSHYTPDDLQRIVQHAHAMQITVIPQISLPDHTTPVTIAYPNLSCNDSRRSPLCAGNDESLRFMTLAIDTLLESFDAPYLQITGQSRPNGAWENCPTCQTRMRNKNLKDADALAAWVSSKLSAHLTEKAKRPFPTTNVSDLSFNEGENQPDLRTVYNFAAKDWGATAIVSSQKLNPDQLDSTLFPRLSAWAEALWTDVKGRKDFDDFRSRQRFLEQRLTIIGVHP